MPEGNANIILDIVVLISLLISIFYMFMLMRGIKKIRESRNEFKQVLKELNQTIARADKSVDGMRNTADQTGSKLQKEVDVAKSLLDELQFINQAGENVARRLEKLTTTTAAKSAPEKKPANAKMSKAEKELADAMAKKGKG